MKTLHCVELPFQGYINFSTDNNIVNCQGIDPMTTEEYIELRGDNFKFVTDHELDILFNEHYKSFISDPVEITRERYEDMLEVMPPCRWNNYGGFQAFHVCERYTGNIVAWFTYISSTNKYYEFK